ncbi:ATP-dependent RNA helicase glh-1-like isoform X2 [Sitodiplosis mosellana]|uniref:ATP-dependent RNA helicase glh-1-like isoform X2 n=1 Tax=Sitodiplosis mosellana TaxID=263140 RepID=UPI002443D247|nr:ATP-dependent RNA helicase glh-1-like isoform X2 [Sitodiplosis mosellana]
MRFTSSWLCIAILLTISVQSQAQRNDAANNQINNKPAPNSQNFAEEVIVESSLTVNPQSQIKSRKIRDAIYYLVSDSSLVRAKRQFGGPGFGGSGFGGSGFGGPGFQQPNYDSSQSTAQSNSHSQGAGPAGFGNANALAGAQAFQTNGPTGSFGATATNAHTDTSNSSPYGGFSGSNANSGGQTYNLPNGQTLSISYNNGFSNTNGNPAHSQGSSVAFSG